MAVLKVQETSARKLFTQLGYGGAKKASPKKLEKLLKDLPDKLDDLDDDDVDKKGQRLIDDVSEAVAKERKIQVISEDDDDDEEEETPKKSKKKGRPAKDKKASKEKDKKSSKKGAKAKKGDKAKKGKKRSGGGPSNKDQIFELWVKCANPKKEIDKWVKKFPEIQERTIRGWVGMWKKGPEGDNRKCFPRISKGRDKEIKAAIKRHKKSGKED